MTKLAIVSTDTKSINTFFVSKSATDSKYCGALLNLDSRLINPTDPNRLDADEFYLSAHLTKRINNERTCYPSIKTLSYDCGWCPDKTRAVLKSLEQKNIIKKQSGGGRYSNTYTVLSPYLKIYLGVKNTPPDKSLSLPSDNIACTTTEIPTAPIHENSKEVLSIESLSIESLNSEVLRSNANLQKNEQLPFLVFKELQSYFFDSIDFDRENPEVKKIENILTGAAKNLVDYFEPFNGKPLPEYRITGWRECNDTYTEILDRIKAYLDFCRLTKTYVISNPDSVGSTLIREDWCLKLYAWKQNNPKYDVGLDDDLLSDWLRDLDYIDIICLADKKNTNRILVDGDEFIYHE